MPDQVSTRALDQTELEHAGQYISNVELPAEPPSKGYKTLVSQIQVLRNDACKDLDLRMSIHKYWGLIQGRAGELPKYFLRLGFGDFEAHGTPIFEEEVASPALKTLSTFAPLKEVQLNAIKKICAEAREASPWPSFAEVIGSQAESDERTAEALLQNLAENFESLHGETYTLEVEEPATSEPDSDSEQDE